MKLILTSTGNNGILSMESNGHSYKICDTLEPLVPVIPAGNYKVRLFVSSHWMEKSLCPLPFYVLKLYGNNIDYRDFEIHPGNTISDTKGCVLVGDFNGKSMLLNSQITFIKLLGIFFLSTVSEVDFDIIRP
jgi:hypothetical protein